MRKTIIGRYAVTLRIRTTVSGWLSLSVVLKLARPLLSPTSLCNPVNDLMAPHVADLNTSRSTKSPPSYSLQMPHVFVIPPEEEQQDNPPWCCFDADLPSNPDLHSLGVPKRDIPPPTARFAPANQRFPMSRKLEKKQRPEALKIIENKPSLARGSRDDSDVIEVVKVKRCREAPMDLEENKNVKRSKTLRVRATEALQSIKNVGKSSHRTNVKELWASTESTPDISKGSQEQSSNQTDYFPTATMPTKKGSLSWSNSRSLSQIFQPLKPSSPVSSFTLRVAPTQAHHSLPATNPPPLPHFMYNSSDPYPSRNDVANTLTIDDVPNRPAFMKPSTKSINSKFSVRELHRLFTFSSSPPDESVSTSAATMPFSCAASKSALSVASSTLSSGYLDISAEGDMYTDTHFLGVESADRSLASRRGQTSRTRHGNNPALRRLSDASFEMKLDSLHFDSLSFDPDDFDVSMEGNGNNLG